MSRRGFALVGVMFALVLLAGIAGTLGFVAWQETLAARNTLAALRADAAARATALSLLAGWQPAWRRLVPGDSTVVPGGRVRRLQRDLYLLEGAAADPVEGIGRQAGLLVAPDAPLLPAAPLATVGAPPAGVLLDSVDADPPGWSCGVRDSIATSLAHNAVSDSALWALGSWSWGRLLAWARAGAPVDSLELVGSDTGMMVASRRLGVLVVDGDLVVGGGASVVGLVAVRGRISAVGAGGSVTGQVLAGRVDSSAGGRLRLAFSSCAVRAVLGAFLPVRPLQDGPQVLLQP